MSETMAHDDATFIGTVSQKMSSCLATLDYFLQTSISVLSSLVLADIHKDKVKTVSVAVINAVANILGSY